MKEKLRKIGIMGGTFDPIHMGHLILGEQAYEQLGLEKVYFMPSGNPPHKKSRPGRAADHQRVEMVRRAISDNPHFELQLWEMYEEGYSYTYRTMEQLRAEHPDTEYYFIIGSDSLFQLDTWMKPERLLKTCVMVVAARDHTSHKELQREIRRLTKKYEGTFLCLDTPNIDISSQMLREWMEEGKGMKYYLPDSVMQYIQEQAIYQRRPCAERAKQE